MSGVESLSLGPLLSPPVLFFILGFGAAWAKSDLSIPDAVTKFLTLYLIVAIGLKGGIALGQGSGNGVVASLMAGLVLSAGMPLLAFALLRTLFAVDRMPAAVIAGHYGSVSVVTFAAGGSFLTQQALDPEPYMPAVMALMEVPAIATALWLAWRGSATRPDGVGRSALLREVVLSGSIVVLVGSFCIGALIPAKAASDLSPFVSGLWPGFLCLFLLDMGLVAGRQLTGSRAVSMRLALFGIVMPIIGALLGLAAGLFVGLSVGGVAMFAILSASASYIAVPAVMRVAVPEVNPGVYMTLSLGITFPFNILIGIPLYSWAALTAVRLLS